jgi:hypothetical protein
VTRDGTYSALLLLLLLAVPRVARAEILPLDAHADEVTLDPRLREIELRGNVHVDSEPFHLRSEEVRLRRTSRGVEVDGKGTLAFCPCLGTPLSIAFDGAIVAPPGDLILRQPRLELYRVPVFWLPYFWLRSPARFGLLPPDIAYRGRDGLFLGDGVHVPWRQGDFKHGLDLRAGAYVKGGVAVEGDLRTPSSHTNVRWDYLDTGGVAVDVRGALARGRDDNAETLAWDADALLGTRAVTSTTDLDAAARVVNRAGLEASIRHGGFTVATGLRSTSLRGASPYDFGAAGPVVSVRAADGIGGFGAYDLAVTGGGFRDRTTGSHASYGRSEGGALLATRASILGASLSLREAAEVASDGERRGADVALMGRADLRAPFVRGFDSAESGDPWRHRLEPRLSAGALATRGDTIFELLPGRGRADIRGSAYFSEVGASSALGRWAAGDGFEASVSGGAVGTDDGAVVHASGEKKFAPLPAVRWRAAASERWIGFGGEGAHVLGGVPGTAIVARARVGQVDGLRFGATIAERTGIDPVLARLLTDAPLEPSGGFLATDGWTGGAHLSVPWSAYVLTRAGADADLSARLLTAARASIEVRDRCECLAIRASGAHRLGRAGTDVWVTIDLAPRAR